jgi:hypothetical protein
VKTAVTPGTAVASIVVIRSRLEFLEAAVEVRAEVAA